MKTAVILLLAAGALVLGATPSHVSATVHVRLAGIVRHQDNAAATPKLSTPAAIKATPNCGASCTAYETAIDQYFTDVAAASVSNATDNVYSVDTQYYDMLGGTQHNITYNSTFGGSTVATNAYPASTCNDGTDSVCLTDGQLQSEIASVANANGWPTGTSNLFFIFTPSDVGVCQFGGSPSNSNPCTTNAFCAYHDNFQSGGSQVVYAVEPYDATIPNCSPLPSETPAGTNAAADVALNTVSHEMNEAITDPLPETSPGWWSNDVNEDEIGDLCAWTFGATQGAAGAEYNQTINGDHYYLQEEFSNAANSATNACVQFLGGPTSHVNSGVGPLAYQNGAVMRTNTIHAIYWIPSGAAAPSNSVPPVVTGTAAVGKTLLTTDGTWSSSPTSFAVQWQRCSSTGDSCTTISGATGTSYRLVAADAAHEIRSEVSATNGSGTSSPAASTPTEAVVPVPAATAPPVVSGIAAIGKTLSTTQGTWNTPVTYAYQWLRCSASGGSCAAISQATSSSYKLVAADRGHTLEARVSATNAAATTQALSSQTADVIGVPAASKQPAISGKAKVGRRLAVTAGTWSDASQDFVYQWLRCGAGGGSCLRIHGATKSTYRLTKRDARHRLRVRVTARNAAGNASSTSSATHVVKR